MPRSSNDCAMWITVRTSNTTPLLRHENSRGHRFIHSIIPTTKSNLTRENDTTSTASEVFYECAAPVRTIDEMPNDHYRGNMKSTLTELTKDA